MPTSRYVSANRLKHMLVYVAVAVVVLVAADTALRAFEAPLAMRRAFAVTWVVALPLGGWWAWRRTGGPPAH